eukprot:JZ552723.1.p1 GENE.JZ552723.1~~JZ552723.1.p1  ORF type:complete len:178 (+),score=86.82 JZ552723.1:131-664(+)
MSESKKEKKSKKREAVEEVKEEAVETPVKKEKKEKDEDNGDDYDAQLINLTPIAKPVADKKLTKKALKLVKKSSGKKCVKRGLKEVVKAIRKGAKGLCILAGDVLPIDVISHIPVFCEEKDVPYFFVPSKQALGESASTKRPTSVILVTPSDDSEIKEMFDECVKKAKEINPAAVTV